jgi:hypothetical protein
MHTRKKLQNKTKGCKMIVTKLLIFIILFLYLFNLYFSFFSYFSVYKIHDGIRTHAIMYD